MPKGIIGKKLGMTQIFDDKGTAIPVTVIEATPNTVAQKKVKDTDGYEAVQLAYGEKKPKNVNKPMKGHLKKANLESAQTLKELRIEDCEEFRKLEVGGQVTVGTFSEGERVDVTGITRGKGFAGAIKRWHFNRGPMGHGSMYHRRPGAGGATDPARVFKGRKLPGRMGHVQRTIQNLEVVRVDTDRNLLLIRGAVPGPNGSVLVVKETSK